MPQIPLPPSATVQTSSEPPRTLWMGDLDPSFDEATIQQLWEQLQRQVNVKLIRAKKNLLIPCSTSSTFSEAANGEGGGRPTDELPRADAEAGGEPAAAGTGPTQGESRGAGQKININGVSFIDPNTTQLHHAGYCFVEFQSLEDAHWALTLNSTPLPNITSHSTQLPTNPSGLRNFRLNWASGATLQSTIPSTPEFSLFVGDLSPTATEAHLLSLFQKNFRSVKTVRVMTDPITGASRCFGFVRFGDEQERRRALVEMNGVWCQGRNLRVAYATPRNNVVWQPNPASQQHQAPQQRPPPPPMFDQEHPPAQLPHFPPNPHHHQHPQQHELPHQLFNSFPRYQDRPLPGNYMVNDAATGASLAQPDYRQTPLLVKTANSLVNNNLIDFPPTASDQQQYQFIPSSATIGASGIAPMPQSGSRSAFTNPNNTTVFVGGLTAQISERQLHSMFAPFGAIVNVKIPPGKGCGFVKYAYRIDAEAAIQGMQGFIVGGNPIRLSWGRTSSDSGRHSAMQDVPSSFSNVNVNYSSPVWNNTTATALAAAPQAYSSTQPQRPDSSNQVNSVPPVHPSLL
ncbi:LADA_0A04038g1_1 [Lachancea dasiensis]|uniref:LADA_0A04038g1_1 n=1 Tax=Lachancea dasiensis TaxID=1072105 RepID=A0A1G4IN69_9SACH|nr:LADA_0A04038g1_1 [Lachancea dasiensis]